MTIQVEDGVKIFPGDGPQTVKIRLKSHSKNVAGTGPAQRGGRLAGRSGRHPFSLAGKYDEAERHVRDLPAERRPANPS